MRKFLFFTLLLALALPVCAEQMQFVTTLSSPVGTFGQVDAADPSLVTEAPLVNFCNTRTYSGVINLRGADAYLKQLYLQNGTTLGGNTQEYQVSGLMYVNKDFSLQAARLYTISLSFSTTLEEAKSQVGGTLYLNNAASVKGAKADSLVIQSDVKSVGTGNGDALEWSNVYSKDYAPNGMPTGDKTYSSYLLKSINGTIVESKYAFVPEIKTVQAAKYCGDITKSTISGKGTFTVIDNSDQVTYVYADSITQEADLETTGSCMCKNGLPAYAYSGDLKKYNTVFTNEYTGIQNCPSGYSDQDLCNQNCNSNSSVCSYSCLKEAANIAGCGEELKKVRCYCEMGYTGSGTTENPRCHTGVIGSGGIECSVQITSFEPKIGGSGKILRCVAAN